MAAVHRRGLGRLSSLSCLLAIPYLSLTSAWHVPVPVRRNVGWFQPSTTTTSATRLSSSTGLGMAVDAISVEGLSSDHDAVGSKIKESVQRWLDAEWMPQEVHERMAESCKRSYCACRESGQTDLMAIMIAVAEDLEKSWREYDADAFVNAWDVGNYVSDYLTSQTGIEGCECSNRIY
jgi:hypothetical protein